MTRPAAAYARASLAPATLRAYQAGGLAFAEWCQLSSCSALPAAPETVAEHLASLAALLGRASLAKRLAAIGQYHRLANQPFDASHPVIHHTLRGITANTADQPAAPPRWPRPRSGGWSPPAAPGAWPTCATVPCCCSAMPARCAGPS